MAKKTRPPHPASTTPAVLPPPPPRLNGEAQEGGVATLAPPVPPDPVFVTHVAISAIDIDHRNDRLKELQDPAAIKGLAASIACVGLLEPIGVAPIAGARFRLVYGHRRLQAVKLLGWKDVPAQVTEFASDEQAMTARAAENTQRLELNPVEEAMAVASLLDSAIADLADRHSLPDNLEGVSATKAGSIRASAIALVAEHMGKSETWVRDRAFLGRLNGKARTAVIQGRLPLAHAREIAKLADPRLRDEIAMEAVADPKNFEDEPRSLADVRDMVSRHLFSLAVVPWQLNAPFAGAPACVECPHNSINQAGLFEHGAQICKEPKEGNKNHWGGGSLDKEPKTGACTQPECFRKKASEASRVIGAAVAKIAKAIKAAPKKQRDKVEREALNKTMPAFVVSAVVRQQLEAKLAPPAKAASKSRAPWVRPEPSPRDKARGEWAKAMRIRAKDLDPKIAAKLAKQPGAWAMYRLFRESKAFQATQHNDGTKAQKAAQLPIVAALLKQVISPSWDGLLMIEKDCGRQYGLLDEWRDGPSGMADVIAAALGVEVDAAPTVEDFLPKAAKAQGPDKAEPASIDPELARTLAASNSAEKLQNNQASILKIHGSDWVVVSTVSKGQQVLEIDACRARKARPGEKGLNHAQLIKLYQSGKRVRGDHAGVCVYSYGGTWILGERWRWSRPNAAAKELTVELVKHRAETESTGLDEA